MGQPLLVDMLVVVSIVVAPALVVVSIVVAPALVAVIARKVVELLENLLSLVGLLARGW